MNLTNDPLVLRSRFRSLLPDNSDIALQIKDNLITVFVRSKELIKLIPTSYGDNQVRIICLV